MPPTIRSALVPGTQPSTGNDATLRCQRDRHRAMKLEQCTELKI